MIKRAKAEDAGILAELAIQMWTDHDPEDMAREFRELVKNEEAACFIKYADLQCKCNKNKKAVTQRGITLKMVVARQPKKEGDLNEPLPSS